MSISSSHAMNTVDANAVFTREAKHAGTLTTARLLSLCSVTRVGGVGFQLSSPASCLPRLSDKSIPLSPSHHPCTSRHRCTDRWGKVWLLPARCFRHEMDLFGLSWLGHVHGVLHARATFQRPRPHQSGHRQVSIRIWDFSMNYW